MRIVHKVCSMIRRHEALERGLRGKKHDEHSKCKECPAWEKITHYGRCQRMCYGLAVEMINIVKWGNPWGRKYRNSRRAWPNLKQTPAAQSRTDK